VETARPEAPQTGNQGMPLADLLTTHLIVFTLVLARVAGLVMTAPLYSALAVPGHVRALIAFALAVLITPTQLDAAMPPATLVGWLLAIGIDVLVGLALGLGTAILMAGAQVAGQLMAQMSGLSLAEVFDPALDAEVPVLSQLLGLFTLSVYLLIGGHRWLMAGLLDSFVALPGGGGRLPDSLVDALLTLMTESFSLGLRCAAPLVIALLLATLVLGLVGRTLPQLNVLSLGFGLNTMVAFGTLALSLGTIAWLFEDQLRPSLALLLDAAAAAGASGPHLR